eukprot:gene3989-biopygen3923
MEAGPPTTRKTGKAASKGGRGAEKSGVAGKPTKALVCFQWNVGKCFKKGCKYAHECSKCVRDEYIETIRERMAASDIASNPGSRGAIDTVATVDIFAPLEKREAGFLRRALRSSWRANKVTPEGGRACLAGTRGATSEYIVTKTLDEETLLKGRGEHGMSLEALRVFENSIVELGAAVPKVTEFADRWPVVFQDDPAVDDLVRPGVGPFSIDACCDESGSNAQTTIFWTVTQECLQQEWEGHNAWCNPPFSKILEILQHFLECKRRQNVGTAACFVMPVWPIADFFKFIEAWPEVFFPLVRFDADADLFIAPAFPGRDRRYFGPTKWPVTIYRVPPRFIDLGENVANSNHSTYETGGKQYCRFVVWVDFRPVFPATERTLSLWVTFLAGCLLVFGACLRKANVTAKKENAFSGTEAMLKKSIRFEGHDKMRVMVSSSKTNQFSKRTHETLIHEVLGLIAFCVVIVTRRAMALNQWPGGPDAPLLCHTKAGGQQVALTHSGFDHWLKTKLKTAGLQPER